MKKIVAVIFGGKSAEHDVSIITAHIPIIQSLEASGQFDVWPVYIAKDGSWYADKRMNDLVLFKNPDLDTRLARMKKIHLLFEGGLHLVWSGLFSRSLRVDVVFPAMHGTYGEDGSLMGLLRMAGVPFVGCDMSASAIAMDKATTKQVACAEGIAVVPYVWFTGYDWKVDKEHWIRSITGLTWPVFVKPVHLGSSIGITKVKERGALEQAIEVALHYDDKVLVEESVENLIEITLPMMGNDEVRFGVLERPLNKTDFFDFNDKYLSGGKNGSGVNAQYSEIPAKIDEELAGRVRAIGKKIYRVLGCAGMARMDFLIDSASRKIYINEVNTLPGSLYHHNWRSAGVSNVELVTHLITLAEERFRVQQYITHTFSSDILKKSSGAKTNE